MPLSYKVITLGCKVNQYESAFLTQQLLSVGWEKAQPGAASDVVVINTCIVTSEASRQSRQAIRRAVRENPAAHIAVTGCYPQSLEQEVTQIEGVHLVAGNTAKDRLVHLLAQCLEAEDRVVDVEGFSPGLPFQEAPIEHFPGRSRAFLKVQDGCEAFCSYCIVPFARGPYRSLPVPKVLEQLQSLQRTGHREVVLTGIHLGKYGVDLKNRTTLLGLLKAIGGGGFQLRVRLSSLEPQEIEPELLEMAASEEWLCRHFHIPMQSGDDGVLRRMNRRYTGREFARLVESIRKAIPLAAIGVDIMAGFPGEDHAAFQRTLSLLRGLPVSYFHVFPFSDRPGTPAASFSGRVEKRIITKRAAEMRSLGREKKARFHETCIGHTFQVLPERPQPGERGLVKGISDNYAAILFPWDDKVENGLVGVRAEASTEDSLLGTPL